ncbi:MAG: prolyl oligopeptidase family serine peptidase [Acidocella sp.]|nr:prolyl oligopeptidase family serine peptidase [Acidocella sp.]
MVALAGLLSTAVRAQPIPPDPYAWLDQVQGKRALAWVRAENAATIQRLTADPRYRNNRRTALRLLQTPARIPLPQTMNGLIYNFWQDKTHVQGVWRRSTAASYRTPQPVWTTILDLDALAASEHRHWVWKGATCLEPQDRQCLIALSNGGEDAVTLREFDTTARRFVSGGFTLRRAKTVADWLDADTVLVGSDWGPNSLTGAGYPFIIKRLGRGRSQNDATPYFAGTALDVGMDLQSVTDGAGDRALVIERQRDFFHTDFFLATKTGPVALPLPEKAELDGLLDNRLIVTLQQDARAADGSRIASGSLVALDLAHPKAGLLRIFTPAPREAVAEAATTHGRLVVVILDNVRGRALVFTPHDAGFSSPTTLSLPDNLAISLVDTNPRNDTVYLSLTGFLTPTTLYAAHLGYDSAPVVVKTMPAQFDASQDVVEQHEAKSTDGTMIPYFIVHPRAMNLNGHNPTELYAYGGFGVSMLPTYSGVLGKLWLNKGGTFVLANIRGGGEFGPAWHDAGLKTKRQIIYDDFSSVAEDLIAHHITDPRHLGIRGGSNGGLLMGVEFTQHPDLFHAVVIEVPLLDMLRYETIEAGASWVGEYGSVANPAERAFLAKISPYENLHAGVSYPEPFIFTTTKDDRVGPQHARKFAAKMAALHLPYYYYEAIEGGHAAGANLQESAKEQALEYTYLAEKLMP